MENSRVCDPVSTLGVRSCVASVMVLLCVFSIVAVAWAQSDCSLTVSKSDAALYRKLQWLEPEVSGDADTVPDGCLVDVFCDTGFLQNQFISKLYTIQCTDGYFNGSLRYEEFLCRSRQQKNTTTYRKQGSDAYFGLLKCTGRNAVAYEIGHVMANGCVKILYTVCSDRNDLRTLFVYQEEVRPPDPGAPKVGCKRGTWGFNEFGRTVAEKKILSKAYYRKYQKQRLSTLFPGRYSRKRPYPYYFNRGHIAPSGDFEECEKSGTYEYINLAPQWDALNEGSWNLIEQEARETVADDEWQWVIYTGTYGKIQTPRGPMYLIPTFNEKGMFKKGYVPVPMLYWKIVHNTCDSSRSTVYVGVNNPEFKSFQEIPDRYIICDPIRNDQNKLYIGSEFKGFVYQCDLDDFLQKLMTDEGIVV